MDLDRLLAKDYTAQGLQLVQSTCLTLATYLGSYLDDLVIVGGLVPTLLIPPANLPPEGELHVGTRDLDLGLSLAILGEDRYEALVKPLSEAYFAPDKASHGGPANHRWKHLYENVTVDLLVAPTVPAEANMKMRVIDENLSAVLSKGLPLAFRDRRKITLTGRTLRGEDASRDVWVCGPGAFVVLKALALRGRGKLKDAYDLCYLLEHYGENYVVDVANDLRPLLDDPVAGEAVDILRQDFATPNSIGPVRAAAFLNREDEEYKADRRGAVQELLRLLGQPPENKAASGA